MESQKIIIFKFYILPALELSQTCNWYIWTQGTYMNIRTLKCTFTGVCNTSTHHIGLEKMGTLRGTQHKG